MAHDDSNRASGKSGAPSAIRHRSHRAADRAGDIGMDLSAKKRGALDLSRDASQHRRHAWLYDDLLT